MDFTLFARLCLPTACLMAWDKCFLLSSQPHHLEHKLQKTDLVFNITPMSQWMETCLTRVSYQTLLSSRQAKHDLDGVWQGTGACQERGWGYPWERRIFMILCIIKHPWTRKCMTGSCLGLKKTKCGPTMDSINLKKELGSQLGCSSGRR